MVRFRSWVLCTCTCLFIASDPAFHGLWAFWLQDLYRSFQIYVGAMLTPPLDDESLPPSRSNGFCVEIRPGNTVSHLLHGLGVRHVAEVRVYSLVSGLQVPLNSDVAELPYRTSLQTWSTFLAATVESDLLRAHVPQASRLESGDYRRIHLRCLSPWELFDNSQRDFAALTSRITSLEQQLADLRAMVASMSLQRSLPSRPPSEMSAQDVQHHGD